MCVLVISDIHGNLEALEAVLEDAAATGYTETICLGDLVGYGASPGEVLDRLDALAPRWLIRGNHDRVCAGIGGAETFSPTARAAVDWTHAQLPPARLARLAALAPGPMPFDGETLLCHGAPHDEDFYVMDADDAWLAFQTAPARICLHGHTHLQTVFRLDGAELRDESPAHRARWRVALDAGSRWLVNPGSVGQPRDGDPRAAYALFDPAAGAIELRRVAYDVARAQRRIRKAGLPDALATRLATGS